jgi:general secretion pathway protein A
MYDQFFGFKERPFKLVPNPAFIYLSRVHEEVLAHLNYAVGYGEGFVEITGEVGTGKTTLCRMFLENLDDNTDAAYIFNPKLDAVQLLKAINDEFGIPSDADSVKVLIDRLNGFLLERKAQGRQVILLVDEAQNLNADVLEQLRLLSNLETSTSKLIQIILVGQPELGSLLESRALRQLNQRITLSCQLDPLSFKDARAYIRHRIHIASSRPGPVFSAGACRVVFNYAGGIPRLINIACDRALLRAYTLNRRNISWGIARQAVRELEAKKRASRAWTTGWTRGRLAAGVGLVVAMVAAGWFVGPMLLQRVNDGSLSATPSLNTEPPSPSSLSAPAPASPAMTPAPDANLAGLPPAPPPIAAEAPPTPSPTIGAAAAVPAAQPPGVDLESVIRRMDQSNARTGAMRAVLDTWQRHRLPDAGSADLSDDETFFRLAAQLNGLETVRVRGHLNLIKRLNLPAILEVVQPGGGSPRFVALVGLADNEIRVSDGDATVAIDPASLAWLWNGAAWIFWENHFDYRGSIPTSSPGESIVALKVHLKTLGFSIKAMDAAYDVDTRLAVETVQARHGLPVDGIVGPLTQIALYNEDRSLNSPRLTAGPVPSP